MPHMVGGKRRGVVAVLTVVGLFAILVTAIVFLLRPWWRVNKKVIDMQKRKIAEQQLKKAAELFTMVYRRYAWTIDKDPAAELNFGKDGVVPSNSTLDKVKPLLGLVPPLDPWKTPYRVIVGRQQQLGFVKYHPVSFVSAGPDRKFGTSDDITVPTDAAGAQLIMFGLGVVNLQEVARWIVEYAKYLFRRNHGIMGDYYCSPDCGPPECIGDFDCSDGSKYITDTNVPGKVMPKANLGRWISGYGRPFLFDNISDKNIKHPPYSFRLGFEVPWSDKPVWFLITSDLQ